MYREMTEGAARIIGIIAITTVGLRQTPNERFRKMSALPRVDKYFYIFAAVARVEKASLPPPREAAGTLGAMPDGAAD